MPNHFIKKKFGVMEKKKNKLGINLVQLQICSKHFVDALKRCSTQYLTRNHKYGIELPKMIKQVVAINRKHRNILLQDAIEQEMKNLKVTFQVILIGQ